jgi:hypothetical protein
VSWDLYVLPLAPGDDPSEALDRLEEPETRDPENDRRRHELANALQQVWPALEAHEEDGYIDLAPALDELPIELSVGGGSASVNIPYWDLREQRDPVTALLTKLVATIVDQTGWSVYDPQAGRVISVDELPRLFPQELDEGVAQVQQPVPAEKHRKRLFGLF